MNVRLMRFLWTGHRWVGLSCACVLVVTVSTGVSLMFQRELGLTGAAGLSSPTASFGGLDRGVATARAERPDYVPVSLSPPPDRRHAWQLVMIPRSGIADLSEISSIDPATGRILTRIQVRQAAASILLKLHTELLGGRTGHWIVLGTSVGLAFLAFSGFTILRRRRRVLMQNPLAASDRWRAVHRWSGLVGVLLILMWSVTGFLLVGRLVLQDWHGHPAPSPVASAPMGISIESVLRHPMIAATGEIYGIGLPTEASPEIDVTLLRRDAAPWRKYLHVKMDRATGAVLRLEESGAGFSGDAVFAAADSIHKGQSDPAAIHWAYFCFVAFPIALLLSGPGGWVRRHSGRRAGH